MAGIAVNGASTVLLPPGGKTATDVWSTPQSLYDMLDAEFGFTLDPCTDGMNAKCARFFVDLAHDGLKEDWGQEVVFMNPPYTECEAWMCKAFESAKAGALVVCLVPVRTDTAWWHEYAMKGEVRFIRGRLRFGNAPANAPFPSAVVVFGPGVKPRFSSMGRS
jgi:site-specific DNA-methyltransferase (adenine-specific)